MRNKILILLIFSIFLISFANAESIGTFKQNSCVNLIQTCSDCSYVKISSVSYPNSSQALGLVTMTKTGTFYNYSYCGTSQLGTYKVNGYGDESSVDTVWAYDFVITPTGLSQSTAQGIGSAAFLFLMLVLTGLFGFLGFKFAESDKIWILGIFFLFLTLIFIVYDVWLGYEYHRTFTGLSSSAMPETIFYIFLFLLVLGLLASAALLFTKWKKIFKYFKREIKSKEDDDADVEDWDLDKQ